MPRSIPSPAALALLARGVTVTRVAQALGVAPPTVSRYLRGQHPAPPEMAGVIAALGDRELAREVEWLVREARGQAVPA